MSRYFIKGYYWLIKKGQDGAEAYNIENNNMVLFNKNEAKVLNQMIKGIDVETIDNIDVRNNVIKIIKKSNMGTFEEKFYLDGDYNRGVIELKYHDNKMALSSTFLEIPSKCDLCDLCNESYSSPCFLCHKTNYVENKYQQYYNILGKLKEYNCRNIILHGANILKEELTYKLINDIQVYNMKPILIIHNKMLYNMDSREHKLISNKDLYWIIVFSIINNNDVVEIEEKIDNLLKNIPKERVALSLRVNAEKCMNIDEIKTKIYKKGIRIQNVSISNREYIANEQLDNVYLKKNFNYEDYVYTRQYNNCMAGKIAIDTKLNILPCPQLRNNVLMTSERIISKEYTLEDFWCLTNEKINQCRNCSRRGRCLDCRATEVSFTGDVYGKRVCEYYKENI